jgi:hypothetical protein
LHQWSKIIHAGYQFDAPVKNFQILKFLIPDLCRISDPTTNV